MEQKDYFIREIEKIGMIMNAIRNKVFGSSDNLSITIEEQIESLRAMLIGSLNFDLDKFMAMDQDDSIEYLSQFNGFNIENIELFADTVSQIGLIDKFNDSKMYLEKALLLYETCYLKDKTYSMEREANIYEIRSVLAKL